MRRKTYAVYENESIGERKIEKKTERKMEGRKERNRQIGG